MYCRYNIKVVLYPAFIIIKMWLETVLLYISAFIAVAFTTLFAYFKYRYSTWEKENIPYIKPTFPFGNVKNFALLKQPFGEVFKEIYDELKTKTSSFGGMFKFAKPQLMLIDPELIKNILTRDFGHFMDRGAFVDEENDPLSAHLGLLSGQRWKNSRAKITPTFTSGKMKMMFHTMLATSKELGSILDEHKNEPIDIKEIFARQSTDVIASIAFGIDCNSLREPDNEFRQFGKKIFALNFKGAIINVLATNFPSVLKFLKIPQIDTDVSKFFLNVLEQTIDYREKNNVQRKDFLDLLIKLKNKQSILDELMDSPIPKEDEEGLTFNELAAHSFVFFAAGFETTSSTLNFCLFELSYNQEIQEKARKEILNIVMKYDSAVTYEGIMGMRYVDKVFQEVLRKYPPIPAIKRECTIEYKVPNMDYTIKKGTEILISTFGLQRDPEHFPDPDKFDPERFSEEEKSKRHPYTHLPFGEGPRNCIGLRFALLQVKIVLATLLMDFRFKIDPKTILPMELDPKNIFLSPKNTVWLQAERTPK